MAAIPAGAQAGLTRSWPKASAPPKGREGGRMYLDDLEPGFAWETAARTVTEDDILAFARDWDPQPFHIDREAAQASPFGGIIASGFHSLVVAFRLIYESGVWNEASMGSPGMEEVRWLLPVRPGDTLKVRCEVLSVSPSQSRPDRGRARFRYDAFNQDGEKALSFTTIQILARRPG